jgi:hypothetical protein
VGPWLPEPLVQGADDSSDPALRTDLDEEVSIAMLIVLESLSPAERSAFLLHGVFGYSFQEVARIVGRTPGAVRKLAGRARAAVEARRPRYPARADEQREIVEAFLDAAQNGDLAGLVQLLDPSVTFRSDGGGTVPAARTVFTGAGRVARIFTAMRGHYRDQFAGSVVTINGAPGLLMQIGGAERHQRNDRPRADHHHRRHAQPGQAHHDRAVASLTRPDNMALWHTWRCRGWPMHIPVGICSSPTCRSGSRRVSTSGSWAATAWARARC